MQIFIINRLFISLFSDLHAFSKQIWWSLIRKKSKIFKHNSIWLFANIWRQTFRVLYLLTLISFYYIFEYYFYFHRVVLNQSMLFAHCPFIWVKVVQYQKPEEHLITEIIIVKIFLNHRSRRQDNKEKLKSHRQDKTSMNAKITYICIYSISSTSTSF